MERVWWIGRTGVVIILLLTWIDPGAAWRLWGGDSTHPLCTSECRCDTDAIADCTRLNLTEISMGTSVPADITTLDLTGNKITEIKGDTWGDVKSLVELRLARNRISTVGFKGFSSLLRLDLSSNMLQELSEDMLSGLQDLEELNLGYNTLLKMPSGDVLRKSFPKLSALGLASVDLSTAVSADPAFFSSMPSLRKLDLTNCSLTSLPDTLFNDTIYLEELILTLNPLTAVPSSALIAPSLRILDLSRTDLVSLDSHVFHGLFHLQELRLEHLLKLEKVSDMAFADLESLEILNLHGNPQLSYISERAFHSYRTGHKTPGVGTTGPQLRTLQLSMNNLKSLPPNLIPCWNTLETLDLQENPWACDDCTTISFLQRLRRQADHPTVVGGINCTDSSGSKFSDRVVANNKEALCVTPHQVSESQLLKLTSTELQSIHAGVKCTSSKMPSRPGSVSKGVLLGLGSAGLFLALLVMGCLAYRALRSSCVKPPGGFFGCCTNNASTSSAGLEGYVRIRNSKNRIDLEWDNRDMGLN